MEKKSAISGEYIITQEQNNSIRVCRIYDNVIASLREAAKSMNFKFDPDWNTRQFGANLIKAFGQGNVAAVGEYNIVKRDNGSIETYRVYGNTIAALREIAANAGFTYPQTFNTRTLGSKLIDFLNGNTSAAEEEVEEDVLSITPDMKVAELQDKFMEMFGGHLRIKQGAKRCDAHNDSNAGNKHYDALDATLAEIGCTGSAKFSVDMTVKDFQEKAKSECGLTLLVATVDDFVTVLPEFSLDDVNLIPKNMTKEKMQELLSYDGSKTTNNNKFMGSFQITSSKTVKELKDQFYNEVGGVLRVYSGRSQADDNATLVSLGAKEGELECRFSRTAGKFVEAFQNELNLKVKVFTKDDWVAVLDGITLGTVAKIPNQATKERMEEFLAYQREQPTLDDKEAKAKKHKYIIRINGHMTMVQSLALSNATKERLQEIWDNDESDFPDFISSNLKHLGCTLEDYQFDEDYESYNGCGSEEIADILQELAGDNYPSDNVRFSQFYPNVEEDYTISVHELKEDGTEITINDDLDVNLLLELWLGGTLNQFLENFDGEEDTVVLLKSIYKKNGLDDSYNLAFMDKNLEFKGDTWYLINMSYDKYLSETPKAYLLETDEEFDDSKLIGIYNQILGLDEFNSFITALIYDGKIIPLYDSEETEADNTDGDHKNYIAYVTEDEDGGFAFSKAFPDLE